MKRLVLKYSDFRESVEGENWHWYFKNPPLRDCDEQYGNIVKFLRGLLI